MFLFFRNIICEIEHRRLFKDNGWAQIMYVRSRVEIKEIVKKKKSQDLKNAIHLQMENKWKDERERDSHVNYTPLEFQSTKDKEDPKRYQRGKKNGHQQKNMNQTGIIFLISNPKFWGIREKKCHLGSVREWFWNQKFLYPAKLSMKCESKQR